MYHAFIVFQHELTIVFESLLFFLLNRENFISRWSLDKKNKNKIQIADVDIYAVAAVTVTSHVRKKKKMNPLCDTFNMMLKKSV